MGGVEGPSGRGVPPAGDRDLAGPGPPRFGPNLTATKNYNQMEMKSRRQARAGPASHLDVPERWSFRGQGMKATPILNPTS